MHSGSDGMLRDQKRPTLALLVADLEGAYQAPIWSAVSDAALAADVNLLCFVGGRLGVSVDVPAEVQRKGLYDLVNANTIAGLIVVSSAIGHRATSHDLAAFLNRFQPLPIVSVGLPLQGIPSVTADSELGMRTGIRHLIVDHGLKRIAFIRGPEGQLEAEARYRAYCEELARHSIPFDMDLVVPGDIASGKRACELLLDARRTAIDALVTPSDTMALSAMGELQNRGLRVPEDVAILGNDDAIDGRLCVPPLTTVRRPIAAMGRTATEMVLALMRGKLVDDVKLPSKLVIRQSCGCLGTDALGAPFLDKVPAPGVAPDGPLASITLAQDDLPVEGDRSKLGREDLRQQLLETFRAVVAEPSDQGRGFLLQMDQMLRQGGAASDSETWHHILSELWSQALPRIIDRPRELARVQHLVDQAHLLITDAAQRYEASRAVEARRLDNAVREIGLDLLAASGVENLMDVLVAELPRIDVHNCIVVLYQSDTTGGSTAPAPYAPLPERCQLALLYRDGERLLPDMSEEYRDAWRSDSRAFVPNSLLPPDRRYSFVVEPLAFQEAQLGFVLWEPGPEEGPVYDILRGQLSAALYGAQMVGQMRRRAHQLQMAVDVVRTSESGSDADSFAQHVVDVLMSRLDTHFVGLYLLEDQWASLWAGTGTTGERMLSEGHRLRIGGSSAVGQCGAARQPRLVRAVDGGAIRVGDRYLADTRSELALPLVSRGVMLGVLSLRSADLNAFRESDVATLTMVADQLASAIEAARLHDRTQRALSELEATQNRYQQQAWAEYLAAADVAEYKWGVDPNGDSTSPTIGGAHATTMTQHSTVRPFAEGGGGDSSALVVPITYSGATIGELGIHDSDSRRWTADEISLVESVVERMGLAAENLRLLDETQRRVAVEQLTRSVTAEMRQTLDVDQVLQSAVRRIGEAFDAAEVTIRLTVSGTGLAPEQFEGAGADIDPAVAPQQEL